MSALAKTMGSNREALERGGIFYVDCLGQSSDSTNHRVSTRIHDYLGIQKPRLQTGRAPIPVPDHADQLREALLDHRNVVPQYALEAFYPNERAGIPRDAIAIDDDRHHAARERASVEQSFISFVRECRSTAHKAEKYRKDGASKHEWLRLMEDCIFRRCVDKESTPLYTSSSDLLLDAYESTRQEIWDCSATVRQSTGIPRPAPDVCLGYPIRQLVPGARWGLERTPLVDNFTVAKLQVLSQHGLIFSPATKQQTNPPFVGSRQHQSCFPFATIDHDASGRSSYGQDFVSCRAANAASRSLSMLEILYRFADMCDTNFHIPGVVSFTSCGPTVRVWTAFSLPRRNGHSAHIMTCIKQSDMTSTWAVFEMHCIISNLLRWAARIHKPKISLELDRWQTILSQPPSQAPTQPEQQTPISPIGPLPIAAVKNHNRVNSLQGIELMATIRKLENEKAELEKANQELQERNAELTSFLKQATGEIREALCLSQRSDSAMATDRADELWLTANLRTR